MDAATPIKLHIGGEEVKDGWKILNVLPGPGVDIVGSCTDLSLFPDGSVDEVYASHVLEHLDGGGLIQSLREICRILKPGGQVTISVPDLDILCRLFLQAKTVEEKFMIGGMIYGGHVNQYDIHHIGLTADMLGGLLQGAGFSRIQRRDKLDLFADQSQHCHNGQFISLNMVAVK
jgi:predicted SAM-dependent methyltransferase